MLASDRQKNWPVRFLFLSRTERLTRITSGMAWLPKPHYGGENEYSLRPHKPNSVGATPTPATRLPSHAAISDDFRVFAARGKILCGGAHDVC